MKRMKLLAFIICISSILSSCSTIPHSASSDEASSEPAKETIASIHKSESSSDKILSLFTGEEIDEDTASKAPFMAVIENSKSSRPQSGLIYADIVYETMAEGGIPRFIALFQKNDAPAIGPIRSLRPYFIDIAKEYNLPFAHCGGSDAAIACVKTESLMSINEISDGSYYWRDKSRKAPHNLYTSSKKILEVISNKNFKDSPRTSLTFDSSYWNSDNLTDCHFAELNINNYYKTSYTLADGTFFKSMDNAASTDRETGKPLGFKNIVIQITKITLNADGQHVDIALTGSGEGYVLSNGKIQNMKWENDSGVTTLKDSDGNIIPLSPGNTIWHIVDASTKISTN